MITPSIPAGALAALSGDWKVARIFSPTASACFNTSPPTFPLAPVIRIIAVSLNERRYRTLNSFAPYVCDLGNAGQTERASWMQPHLCRGNPEFVMSKYEAQKYVHQLRLPYSSVAKFLQNRQTRVCLEPFLATRTGSLRFPPQCCAP